MNIYLGKYGVYIDLIVGLDDFWFGKFLQFLGDFESIFFIIFRNRRYITWYLHIGFQLEPFHKLILIVEKLIKIDFSNFSYMCVKVCLLNDVKRYQAL